MVAFNKFFTSVLLAITYAGVTSAAPWPSTSKHATHRVRQTFGPGIDHPLQKRADEDLRQSAISFVANKLSIDPSTVNLRTQAETETVTHAFLTQQHEGIPFANAVANVAFKDNKIVSFGSSFVKPTSIASSTPSISVEQAIASAEKTLDGKFNNHPATLEFLAKEDNSVALTHVVQIENDETGAWFEAFVDAHSGEVLSVTDFVTKASYRVLPITSEILTQGFQTLTDPQDTTASPDGWHNTGSGATTDTSGNNVITFKGSQTSTTQESGSGDVFVFTQNPNQAPTVQANLDAARTNAFYLVNSVHDFTYRYGFTEATFNFQQNNFGKGGAQNDRVTVSVQDSSGINNADFATPADGQSGRMRMFLWDETNPDRDGALENDIVVHENTHGVTNRMTGGGTGRCLQTTEAGGMGEGWSDTMADWTEKTSSAVPDYVMGQYVINDPAGIRTHPYSTSSSVNPLTYASLQSLNEVHDIGETCRTTLPTMVAFNKFFTSVLLAITYAGVTSAAPWPSTSKHATHRVRQVTRDLQIETFHPESTFETFGPGIDHPLQKRADEDLRQSAISFVANKLSIDPSTVNLRTQAEIETVTHAFLTQQHEGIPFANAVANVAFKDNKIVSFGSSFVKPTSIASSTPSISAEQAIASAEKTLDGKFNNHPATLEFLAKEDNSVALTHVVQIENDETGAWFEAFVDAHSGEVLSVTDFVTKASYRVLPITSEILTQGFQTLTDPQDTTASPDGWHNTGSGATTDTSGNNVITFKGSQTSTTQESGSGDVFVFTQNPNQAPTVQANLDAARTNAFYLVNSVHDFTYRYGFTEATFNFQQNNFGKGGAQNDRVTVSVQDSSGINNADFATPADGQSGRMRMFLWDETNPDRDGALENDIVVHENTHGVTNRMTGGGTGRCLQTTEAGGMGEGWSDTMADWTEKTSSAVPDYVMGQYVINDPAGIRTHPYSTSSSVNPLTYASLQSLNEVHDIGEVWANTLHNVYAALVSAHGWSATSRTNPNGTEGNIVFLHLFLDALLLQPCNPTFLTARSAWIQADQNRFGGANSCTLWRTFASKGLGVNAANHRNDATVPSGC
ncbi:Extracellular metalloproteinase mep [Leucoagaricus sp. SymC.cos]|nr:Extracellular metalloproteinase mep [Leucoagaricus sp. SymC.cos]